MRQIKQLYGDGYVIKFDTITSVNSCISNTPFPNDINIGSRDNRPLFKKLDIMCAWDITKGGNTKVAIIDVLADGQHEDLNGVTVKTHNIAQNSFTGHGINVAGCVSSSSNNGIGISSVGGNTKLLLYNAATNAEQVSWSYAEAAMYEAVADGAKVINLSFYYYDSSVLAFVITNDVSIVSAAGNFGVMTSQCANSNVICVTNVDSTDSNATYNGVSSNGTPNAYHYSGPEVDICAPDRWQWTTATNNLYQQTYNGTSFASPIVAGIVALVRDANPCLTSSQVKAVIEKTADNIINISSNVQFAGKLGAGRINAYKAVKEATRKYDPSQVISGNDYICPIGSPGGSYSVSNLPVGATVTWSASPGGATSINPTTGVFTRYGSGNATVTAVITYSCTSIPLQSLKEYGWVFLLYLLFQALIAYVLIRVVCFPLVRLGVLVIRILVLLLPTAGAIVL